MKPAVIYHSKTGNAKQAAEWIAEGMNRVGDEPDDLKQIY